MTDKMIAQPDLLYGAEAIAEFLGIKKRSAQHLIETKRIPYSRSARPSVPDAQSCSPRWTGFKSS